MSYAVLESPDFPLHARLRLDTDAARPAAVFTGAGRRAVLAHLNVAAAQEGLRAGMSGLQALGLCPALRLWPRHEAAEEEAQALLLTAAWRLSPRVEATAPGLCTAALDGRDPEALRRDLVAIRLELAGQGLPLRAGVGSTPGVARFAAQVAAPEHWVEDEAEFLRPLPVQLLELDERERTLFESLGLRTLGDLARLPQASLSLRLGERGARLWARATGRDQRPLHTCEAPTRYRAGFDLEHPVETLEPLLFLLRRLGDRLAAQLRQASLVAERIALELRLENETTHAREFRLPQPTAREDALFKVLEHHLGTVSTDSAVTGLGLEFFPAQAGARQGGLFESSLRSPHEFYDTVARLAAVMGENRVGTPRLLNSLRPDAVGLVAPPAVIGEQRVPPRPPLLGPVLRRLRPPPAATVEVDGTRPCYLVCLPAALRGEVRRALGPWRRSGEWWDRAAYELSEWDVELDGGGLVRLRHGREGWFVEGIYD